MPWRETSPMEQRLEFVGEFATGLFTMTELSTHYGISRKTGYKWLERYAAGGVTGLFDRSRRPHHSPSATDPTVIEALLAVRRRHPRWGAKKLLAYLSRRDARRLWPSRSTVCDYLAGRGLVTAQRHRRLVPAAICAPLPPPLAANDLWTADFKGEFRTGDRAYCYPLTVRDGCSRFVLRCDALLGRTHDAARGRFERAFAEFGLPARMRTDNGPPFAGPGLGRLSRLSVWWIRLGIRVERIALGHPEQNGSHEQFHAVLKAETARPPAATAAAQQRRFQRFCAEYNHERPHEALGQDVPANHYHASRRPLPRRLPPLEYPGHMETRRVAPAGQVSWRGEPLFLTEALAGESVGFEEVDDGVWTIYFASLALARFDERHRRLHPIATFTGGRAASSAGSAPDLSEKPR